MFRGRVVCSISAAAALFDRIDHGHPGEAEDSPGSFSIALDFLHGRVVQWAECAKQACVRDANSHNYAIIFQCKKRDYSLTS